MVSFTKTCTLKAVFKSLRFKAPKMLLSCNWKAKALKKNKIFSWKLCCVNVILDEGLERSSLSVDLDLSGSGIDLDLSGSGIYIGLNIRVLVFVWITVGWYWFRGSGLGLKAPSCRPYFTRAKITPTGAVVSAQVHTDTKTRTCAQTSTDRTDD